MKDHPTLVWAPATLKKRTEDGSLVLESDDGLEMIVPSPGLPVHPSTYDFPADLMKLGEFSEGCLLHTVRGRFIDSNKLFS